MVQLNFKGFDGEAIIFAYGIALSFYIFNYAYKLAKNKKEKENE